MVLNEKQRKGKKKYARKVARTVCVDLQNSEV